MKCSILFKISAKSRFCQYFEVHYHILRLASSIGNSCFTMIY